MSRKKKIIIERELNSENCSQYATLQALCSLDFTDVPKVKLERICVDLMEWADKSTSFKLTQFMRGYGIPERTYYYWVNKYPEFKKAHWYALTAIGDRREIGAIYKKYDAGTVALTLSQYCSVAAAAESRRAKLRREEQEDSYEDLTNCVRNLVEQKWGDRRDDE
jgi:hypothetical protein